MAMITQAEARAKIHAAYREAFGVLEDLPQGATEVLDELYARIAVLRRSGDRIYFRAMDLQKAALAYEDAVFNA